MLPWTGKTEDADDVLEKWDEFIRIYNSVVDKFVPRGARCRKDKKKMVQ